MPRPLLPVLAMTACVTAPPTTEVDQLRADVGVLDTSDTGSLESQLDDRTAADAAIQADVLDLYERIDDLDEDVATLQAQVATLTTDLAALTATVAALNGSALSLSDVTAITDPLDARLDAIEPVYATQTYVMGITDPLDERVEALETAGFLTAADLADYLTQSEIEALIDSYAFATDADLTQLASTVDADGMTLDEIEAWYLGVSPHLSEHPTEEGALDVTGKLFTRDIFAATVQADEFDTGHREFLGGTGGTQVLPLDESTSGTYLVSIGTRGSASGGLWLFQVGGGSCRLEHLSTGMGPAATLSYTCPAGVGELTVSSTATVWIQWVRIGR